jgi:CheY-like chemotaxis protein
MENTTIFSTSYPLRILIAEDHRDPQSTTKNMLCTLGYHPEVAANSSEMLQMAGAKAYDLILLDIDMPEAEQMIADRLRTKGGFRQICLEARMDHCIRKPVDLRELRLQLKACSLLTGSCQIR